MVLSMGKHSRSDAPYVQKASVNPVVPVAGGTQRPKAGRNRTKAPTAADYGMPVQTDVFDSLLIAQKSRAAFHS